MWPPPASTRPCRGFFNLFFSRERYERAGAPATGTSFKGGSEPSAGVLAQYSNVTVPLQARSRPGARHAQAATPRGQAARVPSAKQASHKCSNSVRTCPRRVLQARSRPPPNAPRLVRKQANRKSSDNVHTCPGGNRGGVRGCEGAWSALVTAPGQQPACHRAREHFSVFFK